MSQSSRSQEKWCCGSIYATTGFFQLEYEIPVQRQADVFSLGDLCQINHPAPCLSWDPNIRSDDIGFRIVRIRQIKAAGYQLSGFAQLMFEQLTRISPSTSLALVKPLSLCV